MAKDEHRLTRDEVRAFMTNKGTVRRGVHAFTRKICHWPYCAHCGLVALKNDVSRKAAKAACEYEDD